MKKHHFARLQKCGWQLLIIIGYMWALIVPPLNIKLALKSRKMTIGTIMLLKRSHMVI